MLLLFIKRFFTVCMLLVPIAGHAQADMHLSQFYETSMLRNPALTGVYQGNYKVAAYYRNQWSTIANPYETILVDLQYRVPIGRADDFFSFGMLGYNDKAGDLNQKISGVYPAINYNKCLDKYNNAYLSLGFVGGYVQYTFDPSKATFDNQFVGGAFDPSNPTYETIPSTSMSVFDLGAGLNLNMSPGKNARGTYMAGISVYHITQPSFSYYKTAGVNQNMRLNINAAMVHDLGRATMFQVQANYAAQGNNREIIAGGLLGWRQFKSYTDKSRFEIYAGVLYRVADAVIPVFKIKYKDFSIGLSYDVNTSGLKAGSKSQGGPEIAMSFTGNLPRNSNNTNTVCPRFN